MFSLRQCILVIDDRDAFSSWKNKEKGEEKLLRKGEF